MNILMDFAFEIVSAVLSFFIFGLFIILFNIVFKVDFFRALRKTIPFRFFRLFILIVVFGFCFLMINSIIKSFTGFSLPETFSTKKEYPELSYRINKALESELEGISYIDNNKDDFRRNTTFIKFGIEKTIKRCSKMNFIYKDNKFYIFSDGLWESFEINGKVSEDEIKIAISEVKKCVKLMIVNN